MGHLEGKVAVVTGAGRGIGRATAELLAKEGANVIVTDLDAGPLEETLSTLRSVGVKATPFVGDVTKVEFAPALMKQVAAEYGHLDILVNNAGYTWDGVIHKMADEQWQAMLDVHVTAPFRLIREAGPLMREAAKAEVAQGILRHRKIVNVSSVSGTHGNAGQANYAAAKMAVVGLTKTVAKEWGPFHINCNAVAFGFVDTRLTQSKETGETVQDGKVALGIPDASRAFALKMIPIGRGASTVDAAGGIVLLCLPYSDYITGQVLEVNGGSHM